MRTFNRVRMRISVVSIISVLFLFLAAAVFIGCTATDIVPKAAVSSFSALADKLGNSIAKAEGEGPWLLRSPGNDGFYFPDTMTFVFDAAPFLDAGLNPEKLPKEGYPEYSIINEKLQIRFESAGAANPGKTAASPKEAFSLFVKNNREKIGYHAELKHYGIALGGGNMFEWASSIAENDKDIVFVLEPAPFASAGTDITAVKGWVFGKVTVDDENGKPVKVDKLLKPYDLK